MTGLAVTMASQTVGREATFPGPEIVGCGEVWCVHRRLGANDAVYREINR